MAKKKQIRKQIFNEDVFKHSSDYYQEMRPRKVVEPKTNLVIALLIFTSALIIYWITQNRSVTFWDVGEYIACSSILGVPHPPGNPFYIILGRFFCAIGFGVHHSLIVNSISGLMSALAVMFTYLFTVKLVSMFEQNKYLVISAGLIAALYNAFSFTFWNNAVEASVYPGRDLVINLAMYLTLLWVEKSRLFSHQNILLLIVYIFFIGFSIHQTALQIVPAVLFIVIYPILLDSIKQSGFWAKAFIYMIVALAVYFIFLNIGENLHIPDLAKIAVGLFFFLITYIHFRDRVQKRVWLFGIAMIVVALSPHLYLLIRSELRPFINEGHPHNLELFSDYVLRRQYGVSSFMERRVSAYEGLPLSFIRSYLYQLNYHFYRYFNWQFFHTETIANWLKMPEYLIAVFSKVIVLFLGFYGMFHQARKNKHSFVYLLSFFFMTCFAMVFVMNLSDAEVRDRDYFFVSAYYIWGIWMAIGSIGLIRLVKDVLGKTGKQLAEKQADREVGEGLSGVKKGLTVVLAAALLALPIINFASQYFIHNRSKEFIALDYGINFLNSVEENAIIFTNGDNDTFPLWYAQAVYDPNAVENIYPAKGLFPDRRSEEAIRRAVEIKTKQIKGIRPDVTIANLSLLNTPWYIRHLRDIEGVIFDIPDEHIDDMRPMRNDRDLQVNISSPRNEESFTVTVPAGKIMLIKDIAAIRIIRHNFGRRPLYMAVTVADEIVFQEHLRNEGMVSRIVSTRGRDQMDIDRLKNNINNVYLYRSIFDDDVYKDDNMRKLITNYGAAHMRISQYYHRRNDLNKAAEYLAEAVKFIEDKQRFYPSVVEQFVKAENQEKALEYIEKVLETNPADTRMYFEAANMYLENDQIDKAFSFFSRYADNKVVSPEIVQYIFSIANRTEAYQLGIDVLKQIRTYDNNPRIPGFIERLEAASEERNQSHDVPDM